MTSREQQSPDQPDRLPQPGLPNHRSRLPLGLVGMVAMIVGVESSVMSHDDHFTTLVASNWRVVGPSTPQKANGKQILCFGDSMVKFGVQPRVIQARLGQSAYNFALYCGSAPSSYFLLRRALESGAKPSAVVVDFQPELLMADSLKILGRAYPEMLNWRETVDLCRTARDPDRLTEFAIGKLIPSVRKRHEVRADVLAGIGSQTNNLMNERIIASRQNWLIHQGAEVLPKNPYFAGEVPDSGAYSAMFLTPWKPDLLNHNYLTRFLDLASSKRVAVYWVIPPNAPAVDARRESSGYNAQYESYARRFLDKYPNLVVVDGRHVNYPAQVFTDPVHLDRQGAVAFTLGLVEVIQSRTVGPQTLSRWVALPDRQAESSGFHLVDYVESGLALKTEADKRRR